MILALLLMSVPAERIGERTDGVLGSFLTKRQIAEAAKNCGTRVRFVDLPAGLRPLVKAHFGFNLDPGTTEFQRDCFYTKLPATKMGFISEPPAPLKKR